MCKSFVSMYHKNYLSRKKEKVFCTDVGTDDDENTSVYLRKQLLTSILRVWIGKNTVQSLSDRKIHSLGNYECNWNILKHVNVFENTLFSIKWCNSPTNPLGVIATTMTTLNRKRYSVIW